MDRVKTDHHSDVCLTRIPSDLHRFAIGYK